MEEMTAAQRHQTKAGMLVQLNGTPTQRAQRILEWLYRDSKQLHLRLLDWIDKQETPPSQTAINNRFKMHQSDVSKGLTRLELSGLLIVTIHGKRRRYEVNYRKWGILCNVVKALADGAQESGEDRRQSK